MKISHVISPVKTYGIRTISHMKFSFHIWELVISELRDVCFSYFIIRNVALGRHSRTSTSIPWTLILLKQSGLCPWKTSFVNYVYHNELNFHVWNANLQSFARTKSEAKTAAHGENVVRQFQSSLRSCTSVPVLCTTLIFSFCLVRLRKHSQPWKKCLDKILLDQFYIIEYSKGFIIAVWPKKCTKLSEDGKLTVKKGLALSSFFK